MNWVDSYYESLEFLYWEPQHIGRQKNPLSKLDSADKVSRHLRVMEVTLNHNLQQFFLLAPQNLRNRLLGVAFGHAVPATFTLHGRATTLNLTNSAQPDLLFTSERDVMSIEMKIGAKCSISQVLKYALLGLALELRFDRTMTHYLLIMGAGEFPNQWRERFTCLSDLQQAVLSCNLEDFTNQVDKGFRPNLDRLREIVEEMQIAFLNYDGFATLLLDSIPNETDRSEGAEVYRNLIGGMIDELKYRQLAMLAHVQKLAPATQSNEVATFSESI